MIEVTIPAMTCNHCVTTITKAVKQADQQANLQFSLANHTVLIETDLDEARLKATIEQTGYEVVAVGSLIAANDSACCGSCHI